MRIYKLEACFVEAGDVIEKCGVRWTVIRALTSCIGPFESRELLSVPVTPIPEVETMYWNEFSDTVLTVWRATEVTP